MKVNCYQFVSLLGALVLSIGNLNAAIIANYDFEGSSFASVDSDLGSTASDITEGGGLNGGFSNVSGDIVYQFTAGDINDGTVLDDDYLSFTVTPDAGNQLTFISLILNTDFTAGAGGQVYVYSSQDGFTGSAIDSNTSVASGPVNDITLDLSSLSTTTSTTEFRVYYQTTATFAGALMRTDDIRLDATTSVVPEPSSIALLGLAGLAAMAFRRRR